MLVNNASELIGNTPLVRLNRFTNKDQGQIYAKLEYFNPGSSVKDRIGLAMIESAEQAGLLKPGGTIIEPTSGNTGIGLALVAATRGYKMILTMPESMSMERKKLLRGLGAQLVLTEGALGMPGAIEMAHEMLKQIPGSYMPSQFTNPANPSIHYKTTGPEIWKDLDGKVDVFVAGVGTGGTVSGVGRFLKEKNPEVHIVAVEPEGSPVLSGGKMGPHMIQGIGAGFIPENYDASVIDEVIQVENREAMAVSNEIARTEGLLSGISSGANALAARTIAERPEYKGKNIVTVLCDTGERYISTLLFYQD